jgi:outer membrane lipoprotein-sorting protein
MRQSILGLAVLALLTLAPSARSAALEQVLAAMDKAGPEFRDMTASVRSLRQIPVIKSNSEERGTVKLKRSNSGALLMLAEFTQPDAYSVAFEKSQFKRYNPNMGQVEAYDLGKLSKLVDKFLLLGFGATGKQLQAGYALKALGEEQISGMTATRIELVPLDEAVAEQLLKAELWISTAGHPVQQKLFFKSEQKTLTYSDIKLNTGLTDAAVQMKVPKGTKIVRQRI